MPFYYVQDVYQINHLQTRLDKRPDIISGKASVASVNGAGGSEEKGGGGCFVLLSRDFRHPKKFFRL